MDLDSVTDQLYGLPLGEFTAERNARAKQARAGGDRALAAAIQQLAKPTMSAWLVNQLARELAAELEPLIALGQELREASSELTGDELRALTRQRHQVVHALVQQARRLAAAAGHRVSEDVAAEVRQTLEVSLADPVVADAVLAGRLSRAAEYAGFGFAPGAGPPPVAQPETRQAADVTDLAAHRRAAAERALAESAQRLQAARAAHEQAEQDSARASEELQAAEQQAEELRVALADAEQRVREAGEADRAARDRLAKAGGDARTAERAHDEAGKDLRGLPPAESVKN